MMMTLRTSVTGVFLVSANYCGALAGLSSCLTDPTGRAFPWQCRRPRAPPALGPVRGSSARVGVLEEHRARTGGRTPGIDDEGVHQCVVTGVRQYHEIGVLAAEGLADGCQRGLCAVCGLEHARGHVGGPVPRAGRGA